MGKKSTEFVIESGVAIPEHPLHARKHRPRPTQMEKLHPWTPLGKAISKLEIGQSFVCSKARRTYVGARARQIGIRVISRLVDDETIRVWRVE